MPSYQQTQKRINSQFMLGLCIFLPEKVLKHMSTRGGGSNDSVMEWLSLHIHVLYIEVFDKNGSASKH